MNQNLTLNGAAPAVLSIRHPLGINLDLTLTLKKQNGAPADVASILPQFVLRPRSRGGTRPFDMTIYDAANGIVQIKVPGTEMADIEGYGVEVYSRRPHDTPGNPPVPTALIARGTIYTEGSAYASQGPLGLINIPVVVGPPGPPGPTGATGPTGVVGETGQRGSMWFTGVGAPGALGEVLTGDMYLDESNGDVYRYNGTAWVRGTF